jgi:hypothetical protein
MEALAIKIHDVPCQLRFLTWPRAAVLKTAGV